MSFSAVAFALVSTSFVLHKCAYHVLYDPDNTIAGLIVFFYNPNEAYYLTIL
jgi:hypothetical protein